MTQADDFKGTYKFKFLLPIFLIIPILMPFFLREKYQQEYKYCLTMILNYISFKFYLIFLKIIFLIFKLRNSQKITHDAQIKGNYFLFVIPNYLQPIQLLTETIQKLQSHPMAKNKYIICLAMQQHQSNFQNKFQKLNLKFAKSFKYMFHTAHVLQKGQCKGKGSNLNSAVRKIPQQLKKINISKENIVINIIDADASVPKEYCQKIEQFIIQNSELKDITYFIPPMIFCKNHKQVPFLVKNYDNLNSILHFQQLNYLGNISFPLSNYSFTYNLAQKFQFFDTCQDAIGQDWHTFIKAFYKTNTQLNIKIIYSPFNMMNIQAKTYWKNIVSKFWQAQRHFSGCADFGYTSMMFYKSKKTLKGFFLFYLMYQNWIFLSFWNGLLIGQQMFYLYSVINSKPAQLFFGYYHSIHSVIFWVSCFIIQKVYIKISINNFYKELINKQGYLGFFKIIFSFIQFFIATMINTHSIAMFSLIDAIFTSIIRQREWFISQKMIVKNQSIEEISIIQNQNH